MNCDRAHNLITARYLGGISSNDEMALGEHIAGCQNCRDFYEQEKVLTDGLRSLDHSKYRKASIDAFGRLALSVRSYRSPKSSWLDVFQVRPIRSAAVAAMLIFILVGMANLNFSYSYTNGANLSINFDPPLKKAESIKIDEFYARLNDALNQVLDEENQQDKISWALQMEGDSLKGISIDIQTDKAIEVADIYDSLLSHYPSLARGEISIRPLKQEVKEKAILAFAPRKTDTIDESEIRRIVEQDLPSILIRVEDRIRNVENDYSEIQKIVDEELPAIRELIDQVSKKLENNSKMDLTTMMEQQAGAQIEDLKTMTDPSSKIEEGVRKLLDEKGLKLNDKDFNRLFHVKFNGKTSRIIIGDANCIFEPYSVGGKKIMIIRGSGSDVDLNGVDYLVKSAEIDDLLLGNVTSKQLEGSIKTKLQEKPKDNETVIIEVWKGEKKAQITIENGDAKVELTSPMISNIKITTPNNSQLDPNEDLEDLQAWKDSINAEREVVLKSYKSYPNRENPSNFPKPSFSMKDSFLPDYLTEKDIQDFASGSIGKDELKQRIERRIRDLDLTVADKNLVLIRNSKIISISIKDNAVSVDESDYNGWNISSGSAMVQFEKKDGTGKANLNSSIDLFKEGIITGDEIEDLMKGELDPKVAEKFIASRLEEKFGDSWHSGLIASLKRTSIGTSLVIQVRDGKIRILIEN